jgi:hypothetical protein
MPNYALEVDTHQAINKYIALGTINGFSLDSYLKNQLGFRNGVEEQIKFGDSKNVWSWIGGGGVSEDKPPRFFQIPYLRSTNHFHDPMSNQGFGGFIFGLLFRGESSIQWSQKPIGAQNPGGHYSWFDTRDYYYQALTSPAKTDRDKYFAETFRGLGQLMHLVHDISVPAHARNQFHVGYDYEKFIMRYQKEVLPEYKGKFKSLLASPFQFDQSLLNVISPLAPIPFANLFDSEKYTGSNLGDTLNNNIGLSEYTNANFFSDRTIFKNYPHPKKENTNAILKEEGAEDGEIDRKYYISGYQSENLALYSYFANPVPELPGEWKYTLDDTVHKDYAQKLIPRAVGYSAGLLQYFFRGNLYVGFLVPSVDQAIYNFGNENDIGRDIGTVAMFIQNSSKLNDAIEPVGQGTISLTISYIDSRTGETVYQPAGTGSVTNIPDMGSQNFLTALFTLAELIPTQFAKELTYYLTFRGELGQEKDAVIGKVIKAPVLQGVSPDQGIEGTLVTITGDYLPEIEGPFPTTSRNVNFSHDPSRPYTAEVINRTDTEITTKVPNTAAILKPGYGGLRVRRVVPETEEMIYSNPLPFFPIAEGEIRNLGGVLINATIEAVKPILGDYNQLPQPVIYSVLAGDSVLIQLITGFTYKATGNTSSTQDIWTITPEAIDFVFDLQ